MGTSLIFGPLLFGENNNKCLRLTWNGLHASDASSHPGTANAGKMANTSGSNSLLFETLIFPWKKRTTWGSSRILRHTQARTSSTGRRHCWPVKNSPDVCQFDRSAQVALLTPSKIGGCNMMQQFFFWDVVSMGDFSHLETSVFI